MIRARDPLTGAVERKVPRVTIFPGSHYVTPRPRTSIIHRRTDYGRLLGRHHERHYPDYTYFPTLRRRRVSHDQALLGYPFMPNVGGL